MATAQMNTVIQHIRRAVLLRDDADRTDGELLALFIEEKDGVAFEALVRRHGPMVLSVCRRVVRNHHDVEDAFQATFLVLARKASSVKPRAMVANWLHGVAYRTALKARAVIAKRQEREKQVRETPEPKVTQQHPSQDLQPLIDQELNGLPATYRLAILLCDLEGKTIKEATQQLGWPQGTLAGRLARGRKMLAKRLTNRGIGLSAGSLAMIVSQSVTSAGVPASLMMNTVNAATLIAAGQATVAEVVPAKVAALMDGVMKAMLLSKLKTMIAVLFVVLGLGAIGGGFYGHQWVAGQQVKAGEKPTRNAPNIGEQKADQDLDILQGEWILEWIQRDGKNLVDEGRNLGLPPGAIIKCVIKGKKWSLGEQEPISFEIDSSTTPKTIDMMFRPAGTDGIANGIYKIEGNTFICCLDEKRSAKCRPAKFETTQDSGLCMMALKKARNKPDVEKEPKLLQESLRGKWLQVSSTLNGKQLEDPPGCYLLVTDDGMMQTYSPLESSDGLGPTLVRNVHYRLGDTSDPPTIDETGRTDWTEVCEGICRLEKDSLTLCYAAKNKPRPTIFSTGPGAGTGELLIVYKRVTTKTNAEEKDSPAKGDAGDFKKKAEKKDEAAKTDNEKLQGTWKLVQGGLTYYPDVPGIGLAENLKNTEIVIDGDGWSGWTMQGKQERTTFRLDATKTPKALDIKDRAGKDILAIYMLGGDNLVICIRGEGKQERPTTFVVDSNSVSLLIYKRDRKKDEVRAKSTEKDAAETELDRWLDAFYDKLGLTKSAG